MKFWVKALIWFGFGGGIGFFAGYQLGARSKAREDAGDIPEEKYAEGTESASEAIERAFTIYRGDDTVIDSLPDGWENDALPIDDVETVPAREQTSEEVPADIPQLHPESMEPCPITQEEFERNELFYEQKILYWYEEDEVLYDEERQEIIPVPEDLLGYGALYGFGGDPNNPVETIYIRNETMGTLYQVELVHGSFYGSVVGTETPDEVDWEDEEDGL